MSESSNLQNFSTAHAARMESEGRTLFSWLSNDITQILQVELQPIRKLLEDMQSCMQSLEAQHYLVHGIVRNTTPPTAGDGNMDPCAAVSKANRVAFRSGDTSLRFVDVSRHNLAACLGDDPYSDDSRKRTWVAPSPSGEQPQNSIKISVSDDDSETYEPNDALPTLRYTNSFRQESAIAINPAAVSSGEAGDVQRLVARNAVCDEASQFQWPKPKLVDIQAAPSNGAAAKQSSTIPHSTTSSSASTSNHSLKREADSQIAASDGPLELARDKKPKHVNKEPQRQQIEEKRG